LLSGKSFPTGTEQDGLIDFFEQRIGRPGASFQSNTPSQDAATFKGSSGNFVGF
jgi:hypothetical protein